MTDRAAPSISIPSISIEELLRWNDSTAAKMEEFLTAHPQALDLPCDIYKVQDVRGLLRHIVAVELRYAQRLAGEPLIAYEEIPTGSPAEIFSIHRRAVEGFRALLADPDQPWEDFLESNTLSAGKFRTPRRIVLAHALLHGIRHYAQLATLLRQNGIGPGWSMDIILPFSEPAE